MKGYQEYFHIGPTQIRMSWPDTLNCSFSFIVNVSLTNRDILVIHALAIANPGSYQCKDDILGRIECCLSFRDIKEYDSFYCGVV